MYTWNPNDLYFWRSTPQNKAMYELSCKRWYSVITIKKDHFLVPPHQCVIAHAHISPNCWCCSCKHHRFVCNVLIICCVGFSSVQVLAIIQLSKKPGKSQSELRKTTLFGSVCLSVCLFGENYSTLPRLYKWFQIFRCFHPSDPKWGSG